MRFPKYSCSRCGKPGSRLWNLKRHIQLCHQGIGECLQNWNFLPRHRPPQLNRHMASETSKGQQNFFDERPTAGDVEREPDYLKIQTEEFAKELGRIAARDQMNQIKRATFSISSPYNADQISAGTHLNTNTEDENEIFGFRGFACDNCLTVSTLRVRVGNGERGGGRREDKRSCDPAKLALNKESARQTASNTFLHDRLPQLVKDRVNIWTGHNPFLVAIRLGNPVEENLTLFSSRPMENNGITFQFSREKHFDIPLTAHKTENHRHILGAIRSGKTPLDDRELTNTIEMMQGVTFGTITICYEGTLVGLNKASQQRRDHRSSESYFVYITRYSALDNVKERWQHDPLADFIASIKSDVLYSRPFDDIRGENRR